MRCNQASGAKDIFTVAAGGKMPVYYNQQPWHQGPYQVYMAKVPEGQSVLSWDGAGQVWFKIFSAGAYTGGCKYTGGSYCFPDKCKCPRLFYFYVNLLVNPKRNEDLVWGRSPKPLCRGNFLDIN